MTSSAPPRQVSPTLATFVIGLPLAAAVLALFHFGPLHETVLFRYVQHPVQMVAVTLFCCALGGLLAKVLRLHVEFEACRTDILPRWDGKPIPVEQSAALMASIDRQPPRIQGAYLGRRIRAILEFICQRRSVQDLDDQMRCLADVDAIGAEWADRYGPLPPAADGLLALAPQAEPATPASGGVLYVDSADGALKFKGSSGRVTTIAAALAGNGRRA